MMYEFAQREQGATIHVCYPGQASTNMTRSVTPEMLPGFMRFLFPVFKLAVREDGGKSAAKASRSSVYLASWPEVDGVSRTYFDTNCKAAERPSAVLDANLRMPLWSTAERLAQLKPKQFLNIFLLFWKRQKLGGHLPMAATGYPLLMLTAQGDPL